jgi:Transcriptional regulator PadR-like family
MRRRPNQLLPLEQDVLKIGIGFLSRSIGTSSGGGGWFHAYGIAQLLAERHGISTVANGTLYRSLHGMIQPGRALLESRLETPEEATTHPGRPRCYYRVTAAGAAALETAEKPIAVNFESFNFKPATGNVGNIAFRPSRI